MAEFAPLADAAYRSPTPRVTVDFYLLGQVRFEQVQALQRRLAYEMGGDPRPRIVTLLCEHEPLITVGRRGSRGHIQLSGEQLRHNQLRVQWLNRGGGCVLHGPGQLSIYPLVPLESVGWNVGEYMRRLQQGTLAALQALSVAARAGERDEGVWGRTGQLAAMGIAVRHGIAQHGMFVNVNPSMGLYRFIHTPQPDLGFGAAQRQMGCLVAERTQGIKMSMVRTAVVEHLAAAFAADHFNVFSGHPLMPKPAESSRESNACAS
jgi:lipoyl(octanoyl) transferase